MIKAEVIFDGRDIIIGEYRIEFGLAMVFVFKGDIAVNRSFRLEQAVKYCMENSLKATEFVKKFGWLKAKSVLGEALKYRLTDKFTYNILEEQWDLNVDDLKRLVESHELIADYYGLSRAKEHADLEYTAPELKDALKQAILDVEACQ